MDATELERRRLLHLRQVIQLQVTVERMLKEDKRWGDDIYGEQYNLLGEQALAFFPDNPLLVGHLVRMPDEITGYNGNAGTERLLARVTDLQVRLSALMGIDPSSLPEWRGLPEAPTTQSILINNSTISSFATNLKGTQVVTANQQVATQAPDLSGLLERLRLEIESAEVDEETKFDALKDSEALQGEIEKKRPVLRRAADLGRSIGKAIPATVDSVNKILDLLGRLQLDSAV